MLTRLIVPTLATALLAVGCVYIPLGSIPRLVTGAVANGQAELRLTPEITSGGFRTQAVVTPYTPADIHHLKLELLKVTPDTQIETSVNDVVGTPIVLEIPANRLNEPISFTRLNANTTYRIKAKAYLDAAETQLVSTRDASSATDIPIIQEDRPTLAKLKVQLIDKAFDGQGSTSLDIASGSLVPTGSESITVTLPNPS